MEYPQIREGVTGGGFSIISTIDIHDELHAALTRAKWPRETVVDLESFPLDFVAVNSYRPLA